MDYVRFAERYSSAQADNISSCTTPQQKLMRHLKKKMKRKKEGKIKEMHCFLRKKKLTPKQQIISRATRK